MAPLLGLLSRSLLIPAGMVASLGFKGFAGSLKNLISGKIITQNLYSRIILLNIWSMLTQHLALSKQLSVITLDVWAPVNLW